MFWSDLAAQLPEPSLGFNPANLNTNVKPSQDFYEYAVGGWLKSTPIPSDKSSYGSSEEAEDRTSKVLKGIFDDLASQDDWEKGSIEQQVADFYASGMNEALIEKRRLTPLLKEMKALGIIRGRAAFAQVLGKFHDHGLDGVFHFYFGQDAKESTRYLAYLNQGGLGLPDRDYYLKDDARSKDVRTKYVEHVAKMLEMAGDKASQTSAKRIMHLETELAKLSWSRTEFRDPLRRYNIKNMAQLQGLAPGFDWHGYFKARKLDIREICVGQPSFFEGFSKLASSVPPDTWATYLRWHLMRNRISALPEIFIEEYFAFNGRFMNGMIKRWPRFDSVKDVVDECIGHSLGQLYVRKCFPPEAKVKIGELVENLRKAMKARIEALEWMQPETKSNAIRKLQTLGVKIGYPDVWITYPFDIERDDYYGNQTRAAQWRVAKNKARKGKPIDRLEWGQTPSTVSAYNNPTMNEIVFPAGILQPPFYDQSVDDAVNYGSIGWVIGHEITHAFDDVGSRYDFQGNLKNWWTEADRNAYAKRIDLIVNQFQNYEPLKGEFINGNMTLGENIADLGGLKVAFAAYQMSLGSNKSSVIGGFSAEQRFFIGFAQVHRNHIRDEALSLDLKTDGHSPRRYRVNGPLSNLPEFHQAFGVKRGDPMMRDLAKRPTIW